MPIYVRYGQEVDFENYSGNKTVVYRDGNYVMLGGNTTVHHADPGSTITLVTNNLNSARKPYYTGADATVSQKEAVNKQLNNLAMKLYYTGYTEGERNLTGIVELASGLTASSVGAVVSQGNVSFHSNNGRGYYDYKQPIDLTKNFTNATNYAQGGAGIQIHDPGDTITTWNSDVMGTITGNSVGGNGHRQLQGLYIMDGNQLNINGDVDLTLINTVPPTHGEAPGLDVAHYYSDAVYVGFGGSSEGEHHGDSKLTINGTVNIDAQGSGLMANRDGYITVNGGGKIKAAYAPSTNAQAAAYALEAEEGTVSMNMGADGKTPGSAKVDITGNLALVNKNYGIEPNPGDHGSYINLALTTKDSQLTGGALNEFRENGNNPYDSGITLHLTNGAQWHNQWQGPKRGAALMPDGSDKRASGDSDSYLYTGSKIDYLYGGSAPSKGGVIYQEEENPITVDHFSGHEFVLYKHDDTDPTQIAGGAFQVKEAERGSSVTLITDNTGLDMDSTDQVNTTLNNLAHKLIYENHADNHLTGVVKISEGLTASSAGLKIGAVKFDDTGTGALDTTKTAKDRVSDPDTPASTLDLEYFHGSPETQMMKGTKAAILGTVLMWRSNTNDMKRRLGDVRINGASDGVWAKYLGGKDKVDSQNTNLSQTYNFVQVGYDKKVGNWLVGAMVDHGTGKGSYTGGRGDLRDTSFGLYGSHLSDDGQHLDIIFKEGRLKNKFHIYNEIGDRLDASYHTWGTSLSVEYGKQFKKDNGFYLDPNVELTIGQVKSKSFTGHSDLGDLDIKQKTFNTTVGRIGLEVGHETEEHNAFLKFALAHEFSGDFKTNFFADDGGFKSTKVDLSDTWVDMELGGTVALSRALSLYGTYTHSFGADLETKWRADVGVRLSF